MLKKIIILAVAAMAIAAVAAPTVSANWTKHHANIEQNETVTFTGQAAFTSAVVGGIECQTDARVEFFAGQTTGEVRQFEVDFTNGGTYTQKCQTSGPLAPCAVKSVEGTALPGWLVHSDGADTITITTGTIDNILESPQGGACGVVQQVQLKPGTVHAQVTPGETCTVTQVHLSGQLQTSTGSKVQVHGKQHINPGQTATYGTSEAACT